MGFAHLWSDAGPVGRTAGGGCRRLPWTSTDATLRAWFEAECQARGLSVTVDRAGKCGPGGATRTPRWRRAGRAW